MKSEKKWKKKWQNNKCDKVALKQLRGPLIQQQNKYKWKLFNTIQHPFNIIQHQEEIQSLAKIFCSVQCQTDAGSY